MFSAGFVRRCHRGGELWLPRTRARVCLCACASTRVRMCVRVCEVRVCVAIPTLPLSQLVSVNWFDLYSRFPPFPTLPSACARHGPCQAYGLCVRVVGREGCLGLLAADCARARSAAGSLAIAPLVTTVQDRGADTSPGFASGGGKTCVNQNTESDLWPRNS